MKRLVAIVGTLLALSPSGGQCEAFGVFPSYISTSTSTRILAPRSGPFNEMREKRLSEKNRYKNFRPTQYYNPFNDPVIAQMNKNRVQSNFVSRREGGEKDEQEESSKRGPFRRIREKISSTFGGNRKSDTKEDEVEYKPNPLDGLRLRLAKAMSNINLFPKKEEWVVACPKTRVGPGQITPCVVNGLDIIIFASRDGQRLDAFANACPHLGSPFDLGTIERKPIEKNKGRADDGTGDGCVDCIVCPVHRTAFEIQSGDVRGEWCPYPPVLGGIMGYVKPKTGLVKFAVRLRGKNVEVRIATSLDNVGKGKEGADGVKGIR